MRGYKHKTTISGLPDIEAAFRELKRATAKNVVRRALTTALDPMRETARELAPVDTGDLRDSIIVSGKMAKVGAAEYRAALRDGGDAAAALQAMKSARRAAKGTVPDVVVMMGPTSPIAHLVEDGTVRTPPQPFMRPAWEKHKDQLPEAIGKEVKVELDKAVAKAQRKAARAAAKIAAAARG